MRNLFKSTNPNAKGNRIATGLIVGSLIGLALLPDPANAAAVGVSNNPHFEQAAVSYCRAVYIMNTDRHAKDFQIDQMSEHLAKGEFTAKDSTHLVNLVNGIVVGYRQASPDADFPECSWVGKVAARMALIER